MQWLFSSKTGSKPAYESRPIHVHGMELIALCPCFRYFQDITGCLPAIQCGDPVCRMECGSEVHYFAPGSLYLGSDPTSHYPYRATLKRTFFRGRRQCNLFAAEQSKRDQANPLRLFLDFFVRIVFDKRRKGGVFRFLWSKEPFLFPFPNRNSFR